MLILSILSKNVNFQFSLIINYHVYFIYSCLFPVQLSSCAILSISVTCPDNVDKAYKVILGLIFEVLGQKRHSTESE